VDRNEDKNANRLVVADHSDNNRERSIENSEKFNPM
jgi:hypothetical protein